MDRPVAELVSAGHGYNVRTTEPEFDPVSGELRGYTVSGYDRETERIQPLTMREVNEYAECYAPGCEISPMDSSDAIREKAFRLARVLESGDMLDESARAKELAFQPHRLHETPEHVNRWNIWDIQGVTADLATEIDAKERAFPERGCSWGDEREDSDEQSREVGPCWSEVGERLTDTEEKRYLWRKAQEREHRFLRLRAWVMRAPESKIRDARIQWTRYRAESIGACDAAKNWDNLWMTTAQWEILKETMRMRLDEGRIERRRFRMHGEAALAIAGWIRSFAGKVDHSVIRERYPTFGRE